MKDKNAASTIEIRMDRLKSMQAKIDNIKYAMTQIVTSCMAEGEGQWYAIDTFWGCPSSPFGWCAYHIIEDRAHDNCIYCHEPQERK